MCVCVCIGGIISPLRLCGARKDSTEENLPENVPKGTVELLPMRVPLGGSLQLSSRELEQGSSFPRKSFKGLAKVILIRSKRESIFKNEGARTKVQRQVSFYMSATKLSLRYWFSPGMPHKIICGPSPNPDCLRDL